MNVEAILRSKGRNVFTVGPERKVTDAVALLRRHEIGALIVSRNGTTVEGILTERDVIHTLADHGSNALDLDIAQLMSRRVDTCKPEDSVADLMALMTERRIRHLPVIASGTLVGIVSIGDVVKSRIDEVESEATSMREFIAGS